MDLASMIEREEFFKLFFPTVEHYYDKVLHKKVQISFATKDTECNIVIKPFLSAATYLWPSRAARKYFYSEWNIRNSLWKNVAVKTYIFFITRTGKYFSQYKLRFSPSEDFSKDTVIAPNNRSIRIFDYNSNTVGCIIKDGFTSKYFSNQLEFRKRYKYDFMVPLLDSGENWFLEPILSGHPLARITNKKVYNNGIDSALESISILSKNSIIYKKLIDYLASLINKVTELIFETKSKKNSKCERETRQIVDYVHNKIKNIEMDIPLCISHGDFQGGNMWVDDKGKTWLYDWETVGERSVWYDSAVLCYSLRSVNGWETFLRAKNIVKVLYCDPNKNRNTLEIKVIKYAILLEDIIFYLEDMLELPLTWGSDIYDLFISRIYKILIEGNIND